MSFKINTIKCPQCGSTKQSSPKPNHYVCLSCEAEFVILNSKAPKQHVVTHTIDQKLLDRFSQLKHKVWIFLVLIAAVVVLLGGLGAWQSKPASKQQAAYQSAIDRSRIVATTVYQEVDGPAWLITAAEPTSGSREDTPEIIIMVSSLTKEDDSAQQRLVIAQPRTSQPVRFKRLPNGELYAVMLEAEAYRFNPVSREFEAMNQAIQTAHPQALSAGISKVKACYGGLDGACLELLSNSGIEYVYYPVLDRLILASDKYDAGEANVKALAREQQWMPHYFFKEVNSSSQRKQAGKYLLKGTLPQHNGGPYREGYVDIYDPKTDEFWIGRSQQLLRLSTGYAVFSRWGHAYHEMVEMTPGKVYFNEEVLAQNASQVLLRFDATPSEADRFLQVIDKASGDVVWSRPIKDFPGIDRNGTYVTAEGLNNGFLIIANVNKPSVLVDLKGEVVRTFQP
ncbi:hypothetical protein AB8Q18_05450 [Neisseriaceae bacterium CLB008]